jgi:hypothetical protein
LEYIILKLFHFQIGWLLLISSPQFKLNSTPTETIAMNAAQPALVAQYSTINDEPEMNRVVTSRPLEPTLSEWDRARETSKTWSMEQD